VKQLIYFIKLYKPHWPWLLAGGVCSFLATLAGIGLISLSGWLITACAVAGIAAPDGVAFSFNFMQPAAEIRALAIIRTVARYAERVVTHNATLKTLSSVRVWLFSRLAALSSRQLSASRGGDVLSRLTQDIDALDALYLRLLLPACMVFLTIVGAALFLYYFSPTLSLIIVLMLLSVTVLTPWLFYMLGQQSARLSVTVVADLRMKVIDMIQGLADLIAFRAVQQVQQSALTFSVLHIQYQGKINRLFAGLTAINTLISQMAVVVMLVIGADLFQREELAAAEWVMLTLCVMLFFELVATAAQSFQVIAATQQSALRIKELADQPVAIKRTVNSLLLPKGNEITLKQVSFCYPEQQNNLLKSISLTIPEAKKIAIIGASGVGKTTFLNLLLRYDDPQSGVIELSGCGYQRLQQADLVSRFGLLSQRSQIFAASIKDNLRIAKPDATDNELVQVIENAGLAEFYKQLPDGLNTWIGEDGRTISGGEARRLTLARVLLKNAPILLLDEPTEGLDMQTEHEVLEVLKVYARRKTVILVTHKLSVLDLVEDVYHLVEGKLLPFR
jgi:ATP-binding cassette subfamily C protein CydC